MNIYYLLQLGSKGSRKRIKVNNQMLMFDKKIGDSLAESFKSSPIKRKYETCAPPQEPHLIFKNTTKARNSKKSIINEVAMIPIDFNINQEFSNRRAKNKLGLRLSQNFPFKDIKDQLKSLKMWNNNNIRLNYYRMNEGSSTLSASKSTQRENNFFKNKKNARKVFKNKTQEGIKNKKLIKKKELHAEKRIPTNLAYRKSSSVEDINYDKYLKKAKFLENFEKPMLKYSQHSIGGKDMKNFKHLNGYKIYQINPEKFKPSSIETQIRIENYMIDQRHLRKLHHYFKGSKTAKNDPKRNFSQENIPQPSSPQNPPQEQSYLQFQPVTTKIHKIPRIPSKRIIVSSHRSNRQDVSNSSSDRSSPVNLLPLNIKTCDGPNQGSRLDKETSERPQKTVKQVKFRKLPKALNLKGSKLKASLLKACMKSN
ncbi:unnamed protein product [Moneuplotes crassus]|uniref:Uncharacterized protein n=1 Tax=Euplotes crassus TaxID=5936 RepID=A0AAD1X7U1_EUPCR|nr:unnamed protein product [Moneuplotes crassus]